MDKNKHTSNEALKRLIDALRQENDLLRQCNDVLTGNNELMQRYNDALTLIIERLLKNNDSTTTIIDLLMECNDPLLPINDVLRLNKGMLEQNNEGLPEPEEDVQEAESPEQLRERVEMRVKGIISKDIGKSNQKKIRSRLIKILMWLWKEEKVSLDTMRKRLGVSHSTMSRTMLLMREHGWVRFEGYRKDGWYVLKDGMMRRLES